MCGVFPRSAKTIKLSAQIKKLLGVKSLDQAFEIQSSFAKRAYDDYMQQVSKIGGMYSEFAKEAVKPVTNALQAR